MGDDLSFVPAKLMDPLQTWRNVIRDDEASATMDKEGEEGLLILRQGKWRVRICRIVSDEKFETLGLEDPPGWVEWKSVQKAEKVQELQEWEESEPQQKFKRKEARQNQLDAMRDAKEYLRRSDRGRGERS